MERPSQITNDEEWFALCADVVRTASGILDGSADLITGARRLSGLSHRLHADKDPDFVTFIGIDSETDRFPVGEVRQYWSPEALSRYDAEREQAEQHYRPSGLESARKLVEKYVQKV
jgi:Protein of unknown function (DUF2489)